MKIKTLKLDKIRNFLDIIEKNNNNPRFDRTQFEKLIDDGKESKWLVLEDNNKYLGLCVIREFPKGIIYLREIQSLYKGYGKIFIQMLLDKYNIFWWTSDYSSGEDLLNYYRQFDVTEYNIGPTKWSNGIDHHIFYKTDNKHDENKIITIANSWRN